MTMAKILLSLIMVFFKDLFYFMDLEEILHYKFSMYNIYKMKREIEYRCIIRSFFYRFVFD